MMRELGTKICVSVTALLIALLLVEVIVRVTDADRPVIRLTLTRSKLDTFAYDPILGWTHLPGVAHTWAGAPVAATMDAPTNAQGFRSPVDYTTRKNGAPRIALLGDSQVFGFYVGDQDYLGAVLMRQAPEFEVYSFGVPGYGPPQELLLLERVVLSYHPDVVVLVAFLDNDLIDAMTPVAYGLVQRPYVVVVGGAMTLGNLPVPAPLIDNQVRSPRRYIRPLPTLFFASAAYRLIVSRASVRAGLADMVARMGMLEIESIEPLEAAGIERLDEGFRLANGKPPVCTFLSRCPASERLVGLEAASSAWAEMHRLCEQQGVRFIVLISPPFVDLRDGKPSASEAVSAELQLRGIEILPFFEKVFATPSPVSALARDQHWSEATTVLAAEVIRDRLTLQTGRVRSADGAR